MFTTAFVLADNRMILGPDLQQSYDYLTITPKLRSTYDRCLIYKTSLEGRKALQNRKIV